MSSSDEHVEIINSIFKDLSLPKVPRYSLTPSATFPLPSSYNLHLLSTTTTLLSTLTPALLYSRRNNLEASSQPQVTLSPYQADAQYLCERLYSIDGIPSNTDRLLIGGLHATGGGGHVRIHDGFPNHRSGTLKLFGLPSDATREDVAATCLKYFSSIALETAAHEAGLPIYALRSPSEWSTHPQSAFTPSSPILLKSIPSSTSDKPYDLPPASRPLSGIRILDLSRVIAAPCAGKLLASFGADILWITSPNLPSLPVLDLEFSRGKRSIQLDLNDPADKDTLKGLVADCDVFLQSYRPGSLAAKGFSPEQLVKMNPNIICANLSAFGPDGPWAERRGFDSLVQTCTGMNYSEAEQRGDNLPALPLPCQALDHASGHLLATGICAALYHRSVKGGAYTVTVSLAATQKFLESMGRIPASTAFEGEKVTGPEGLPEEVFEEKQLEDGLGMMRYVKAAGRIEGVEVGWERMPGKLGRDKPEWLPRPAMS
ncbi:CoA-transferase family III [Sarocladium strictum]